ncbi:MFS transporter [Streptomyces sp. NPDC014889]|uniref:MFS transporter n=1 Tax=Streptomyces sp. NPDC014889 TaxID=3364928 RepID=UPI0036F7282F
MGSVFFAATAGLLYVSSLYLQEGRGLGAFPTAAIMAPMSLGIIVASFTARGLIESLGRRLVETGLALVGAGALAFMLTVHGEPNRSWLLCFPLFVCGLGMGCCFGSVFAVTLGDVTLEQAGSASGTLNAVQQLANSAGSALISTLYLARATGDSPGDAVTTSLVAVPAIIAVRLACLPLLPPRAAPDSN